MATSMCASLLNPKSAFMALRLFTSSAPYATNANAVPKPTVEVTIAPENTNTQIIRIKTCAFVCVGEERKQKKNMKQLHTHTKKK